MSGPFRASPIYSFDCFEMTFGAWDIQQHNKFSCHDLVGYILYVFKLIFNG